MTPEKRQVIFKNNPVHYHIRGRGDQAILLVHGFGEDGSIWNKQVEYLSGKYKIVIPDLPGSGNSPDNQTLQSIEDFADALFAVSADAGLSEFVMLGHSMGGYITLAFAEKYPEMLLGYGLIHSTAFADSDEKKKVRQRGIEAIAAYGSYAFLKNTIPNLFAPAFKEKNTELVNHLIEQGRKFSTQTLQQYYSIMMQRNDRCHVLQSVCKPVLFMMGTEDIATPVSDVLQQVHLSDISEVYLLEETGHMSMWEKPDKLNQAIESFMLNIAVLP